MANPRPREVGGACRIQVLARARTQETVGGPNEAARSEVRRDGLPVGVKSPSMHYIVAQLQKPQNRHYSALGPLYLKIKVSKMSFSLSITDIGRGELSEIKGDRQFAGSDFTIERGHFIFCIRHTHGQRNDVIA